MKHSHGTNHRVITSLDAPIILTEVGHGHCPCSWVLFWVGNSFCTEFSQRTTAWILYVSGLSTTCSWGLTLVCVPPWRPVWAAPGCARPRPPPPIAELCCAWAVFAPEDGSWPLAPAPVLPGAAEFGKVVALPQLGSRNWEMLNQCTFKNNVDVMTARIRVSTQSIYLNEDWCESIICYQYITTLTVCFKFALKSTLKNRKRQKQWACRVGNPSEPISDAKEWWVALKLSRLKQYD